MTSGTPTGSYTSKVLGRGSGEAGFAYMLSDRVFGAISSYELDDPEDLRVGDLLKLDGGSTYGVVVSRDGDRFTYASCDGGRLDLLEPRQISG